MYNKTVPQVTFHMRVRDESIQGDNPYRWQPTPTDTIFGGKRVIVFALPGAFTPTCSSTHAPRFDELAEQFSSHSIDDIYCLSVNDAFVMFQWGKHLGLNNIKMLPDGSGEFSRKMGMLVAKDNLGFGLRSWRYAMVVNDGEIEEMFVEPDYADNCPDDPFEVSDADTILAWLNGNAPPTEKPARAQFTG